VKNNGVLFLAGKADRNNDKHWNYTGINFCVKKCTCSTIRDYYSEDIAKKLGDKHMKNH